MKVSLSGLKHKTTNEAQHSTSFGHAAGPSKENLRKKLSCCPPEDGFVLQFSTEGSSFTMMLQ
jgi:hypothetical protein